MLIIIKNMINIKGDELSELEKCFQLYGSKHAYWAFMSILNSDLIILF